MRLALICQHFNLRGGVSRDAYMFSGALLQLGVEIHCYSDPSTSTPLEGVVFHDIPSIQAPVAERLSRPLAQGSFAYRATRAVGRDRGRYDVVYVVGTDGWEQDAVRVHAVVKAENRRWPRRGGRGFKVPRLRARLAPLTWPQNALERTIQRRQFSGRRARRLVAVTEEVRQDLQTLYSFPEEQIDVLACPIDLRAIRNAPRARLRERIGVRPEADLVLFLGNDFYRKGLDQAIRVLPHLESGVHLVVVGSGPASMFRRLAERLGVRQRVHFIGHVQDPERFLRDADILLLPTREDVWGTALIEAMAAGLPIVTTSTAGASSVVADAGAGVVVEQLSTSVLAEAASRLLEDPARRRGIGENGRTAAEAYDVHRMAPALHSILERAAAAG